MAKSDSIQFKYREIPIDHTIITNFANEDRMHFSPMRQSDELLDLMQELSDKIMDIIDNKLTLRQKQVIYKVYIDQLTQSEAGKELGICQTSIHKSIMGNLSVKDNYKRYGGSLKKIRKICSSNKEIQDIINRIAAIRYEISNNVF